MQLQPPAGPLPWRDAGGGGDQGAQLAPGQQQHQQQQHGACGSLASQQTLEEQLEASMQLCSDDSGSEGAPDCRAGAGLPPGHCEAADPDELIWYQCTHAVKGMRQPEQPG